MNGANVSSRTNSGRVSAITSFPRNASAISERNAGGTSRGSKKLPDVKIFTIRYSAVSYSFLTHASWAFR